MGVLLDVLNIAKEKKYMVLAHVQQDTSEPKSALQILAKKKVDILRACYYCVVDTCHIYHMYHFVNNIQNIYKFIIIT